jgi:hypothetical protein
MKTNLVRVALVCAALALPATAAFAKQGDPIPGTVVGLEGDPGSIVIARGVTDSEGKVSFGNLAPGNYVLVIDGPGFVAAMDRLAPSAKKSSSGLSLGIGGGLGMGGGVFGGGSSHKSSSGGGAGPVGGAQGGASHDNSSSSGGGVGMGMNIPIGGGDSGSGGSQAPTLTFSWTVTTGPGIVVGAGPGGGPRGVASFSSTTPYCRDVAGQGMRFGFTIPENESPRPQEVVTVTLNITAQPT